MFKEKSNNSYTAPIKQAEKSHKEKTMASGHTNSLAQIDITKPLTDSETVLISENNENVWESSLGYPDSISNYYPGKYQEHLIVAEPSKKEEEKTYVVKADDSISAIAKKHGVTRQQIIDANPSEIQGKGTKLFFITGHTIVISEKDINKENYKTEESAVGIKISEDDNEQEELKGNISENIINSQKEESNDVKNIESEITEELSDDVGGTKLSLIEKDIEIAEYDIEADIEFIRNSFNNGISGSVGKDGDNYYLDVIIVSKELKKIGYDVPKEAISKGVCSDELNKFIYKYQTEKLKYKSSPSRIDSALESRTASGERKIGGTWNNLNSSAGKYKSGLTNIYGNKHTILNSKLNGSSKVLKGDVGADLTKNKAENYLEDVKKVVDALKALKDKTITITDNALKVKDGKASKELIDAITQFQTNKKSKYIDGNITSGGGTEKLLFLEERKDFKIDKLCRTKLSGGNHKFATGNLQDGDQYMETIDKLAENIGLDENSDEAKVIKLAEKAAINEDYFNDLTKEVPFKVNYSRKKIADNTLNPILENRMMKFHKFMVVTGFYRGNMSVGNDGAVRDPKVAHKWAVEHYIVTDKTTVTIKANLLKMYNDSSLNTYDKLLLKDIDGNDWAKKSYFTVSKGKATDVDMEKVKAYVNTKNHRGNKKDAAAEGYQFGNKKRYPLALNSKPNRSNHIEGNAIDISSRLFIERDDAIIDLIALKFGIFRCASKEQWHFELTNVALDEAEINQHLTGVTVNSPSNSSSSSVVVDKSKNTANKSNEKEEDISGTKDVVNKENLLEIEVNNTVSDEVPEEIKKKIVKPEVNEVTNISNSKVKSTIRKEPVKKIAENGYISASVGQEGRNDSKDVKFVAFRLYALGYVSVVTSMVSGSCGPELINAIVLFQKKHFKFNSYGLVEPKNLTIKKIVSITESNIKKNKENITADKLLEKYKDDFELLGKETAKYVNDRPDLVRDVIIKTGYWKRDNVSTEICLNIIDLNTVDKSILQLMYDEIWDIGINATYVAWIANPAIGGILSVSNLKDFKQIRRLESVLKGDNATVKDDVNANTWISYIKGEKKKINDKKILKTILKSRNVIADHSKKLKAQKKGSFYGGSQEGTPSSSKANKAQIAAWEELAGEGGYESINTWDGEIFTWGKGFAAGGQLPAVIEKLLADSAINQKFQKVGITQIEKVIYVVDTSTGKILVGTEGYKHIAATPKLLHFFIELGENKKDRPKIVDAQYEVVMSKAGKIPDFVIDTKANKYKGGWNDDAVKLASHLTHWLPAGGWNIGKAFYKSSDGNILKIVQAFCLTLQKNTSIVNLKSERYIWETLKYTAVAHLEHKITGGGIGMKAVKQECPTAIGANKAKTEEKYKNHILLPVEKATKYYVIKKTI